MNKFIFVLAFSSSISLANKVPDFSKISPWVKKQLSEGIKEAKIPVMVRLLDQADLQEASFRKTKAKKGAFVFKTLLEKATRTQKPLIKILESEKYSFESFYITNAIAIYDADKSLIAKLSNRSDIEQISSNKAFKQNWIQNRRDIEDTTDRKANNNPEKSLIDIKADRVWKEFNTRGKGIVIGGQDTGVQWDHPALKKQYRGFKNGRTDHKYNWFDVIKKKIGTKNSSCGINSSTPCDDNGHGTHTVGTMIGTAGSRIIGVAPDAEWVHCKNMDAGVGRPSTYIGCFEWFIAPYPNNGNKQDGKPEMAPHVLNNSWYCNRDEHCEGSEMLDVFKAVRAAGIVNTVIAGNEGSSCSTIKDQPAIHTDLIFSVGAYDHRNGRIASFSSRGPSTYTKKVGPDVTAPGVSIYSSIPKDRYSSSYSGTSMAGPHVAGMVALILSSNPELIGNVARVEEIMRSTATKKTSTQSCGGVSGNQLPNNTYGYGAVNAYEAVKMAKGL